MDRRVRLIKRVLALVIVLAFSIESFAAVVGDNDGAAFITKAEFDSLKSTFQDQINRYNQSIDNKIDGAIAGYLAGISGAKTEITIPIFLANASSNDVSSINYNDVAFCKSSDKYKLAIFEGNVMGVQTWSFTRNWTFNVSNPSSGYRVCVDEINNKYYWAGYNKVHYDWDILSIDCSGTKSGNTGGFGQNTTNYFWPVSYSESNGTIKFDEKSRVWLGIWTGAFGAYSGSSIQGWTRRMNAGQAVTQMMSSATSRLYDFAVDDDTAASETKLYAFNSNTEFFDVVFGTTFCATNNEIDARASISNYAAACCTGDGVVFETTKHGYKHFSEITGTVTIGTDMRPYKNYYWPAVAPVKLNTNSDRSLKFSELYYNDRNKYTYQTENGSVELNGYKMTSGVPLVAVKLGQKIKWDYKFSNESAGRKIYVKYGEFDSTSLTGNDIVEFDASNQSGTIEMDTEKSDMLFVKWTSGNTMLNVDSRKLAITTGE